MKKLLLTLLSVTVLISVQAQENKPISRPPLPTDFHSHMGFHFEFGVGPAFGGITDNWSQGHNSQLYDFSGTGTAVELKFGGALQDNLVLTFDILSKAIVGPTVTLNGMTGTASDDYSLSEVTYGGGLTYYVLPSDIFFAGTIGAGTFVIDNSSYSSNTTTRSKYGFSLQLKAGKHWWISGKWGISLGLAYGFTSVDNSGNDVGGSFTESISSDRFSILVSIGTH